MKILITGVAGFIGVNLALRLLHEWHSVYGLDNFFSSDKNNLKDLSTNKNFHFFEHDILDELPKEIYETDFDEIYHLACPASPPKYQQDHIYTLRTNFEGTLRILNLAKAQTEKSAAVPKFMFSSTSEVYGDPARHPQDEEYRGNVNPHGIRSCYDEGKRVAESLCMNFWRMYKLPIKIVRIFNTYGPYMDQHDGRVISNFITAALKDEDLVIYGDGKQTRSFQYIDDLIDGLTKYMALDEDFPGPINLGNDREVTMLSLAKELEKIIGKKLKLQYTDLPQDDPKKRRPDISLAQKKLNWKPQINLPEGLAKTIGYFREHIVSS